MAYGVKYRFRFESVNGTVYRVNLSEDGYSGTITTRPLGKAPVIRMQDSDSIRSTSCDLVLECQVDQEFVDLYTTDPFQYKVEVQKETGNSVTGIWTGFVATEIYSEPDIAPPYDVKVTATDGIGILKEYTFEESGLKPLRAHLCDLFRKAGSSSPMFYYATQLCEYGYTAKDFMNNAQINMDYMVGKSCYDVLKEILSSLRSVLMYRGAYWLLVREVDAQIDSSGLLTVVQCLGGDPTVYPAGGGTIQMGKSVGKMGVADIWPVGHLTRRVSPAKKSVKVTSDWHVKDGSPDLSTWSGTGDYSSAGSVPRYLGSLGGTGTVYGLMLLPQFTMDVKVRVKCWRGSSWQNYNGTPYVMVTAMWQSSGSGTKYYHPDTGWTTSGPGTGDQHTVDQANPHGDPAIADSYEVTIPCPNDSNTGNLVIYVVGHLLAVYDVDVELIMMKGYEDTVVIDNGARGSAPDLSITGGRELSSFLVSGGFVNGVWSHRTRLDLMTSFSDSRTTNHDFMSLTALSYAAEVAAPRIEISGKLNHEYDRELGMPAPFIKSHGVWALMKSFSWEMGNEDVDFTAITLPTATLTVSSENITSIPND